MTIAADSTPESSNRLKRELRAAEAKKRAMALLLIAPLTIFLLLIFVVPIGALLTRAVQNPEIANALPHTVSALHDWDRKSVTATRKSSSMSSRSAGSIALISVPQNGCATGAPVTASRACRARTAGRKARISASV